MLLNYIINSKEKKQRQIGRYWASDIYSIIKGYLKPQDFLKEKEIDLYGSENIAMGLAIEEYWNKVFQFNNLDYKYQDKQVIKITNEIELVVVSDFNFKTKLLELKFPDSPTKNEIPDKWAFQLEAQAKVFQKPVYLGIVRKHPLLTEILFKPSIIRWNNIVKKLKEFDLKVRNFYEKQ